MSEARILLERQGDVAIVSLNRAAKHNGVDLAMIQAMMQVQRQVRRDKTLRAVILRGLGPSFCSGLDFKSVLARPQRAVLAAVQLLKPWRNHFQRWSMDWRDVGVPVIAVVHGNCFGAGLQLALGADLRIAAPNAVLSVLEAKWGLIPDMGGAALLRELLPIDLIKEITFTGRMLSAKEAKTMGLVTHVSDDPMQHAMNLIAEIRQRSPDSVAAGKSLMQQAFHTDTFSALRRERIWQRRIIGRKNQRIAMQRNQQVDTPFEKRDC